MLEIFSQYQMFSPLIRYKRSSYPHPSPIYHRINIFSGDPGVAALRHARSIKISRASKTHGKPGGRDVMRPTHDGPSLPNSAYRHPANM